MEALDGSPLDNQLCDIKHIASENYEAYKEFFCQNRSYQANVNYLIFVTKEERQYHESIENKTKDYIIGEIKRKQENDKNRGGESGPKTGMSEFSKSQSFISC